MNEEQIEELVQAQYDFCTANKCMMFAPIDGKCFYCNADIISEKWRTEHVTGCPNCSRSFCD